MVIYKVEQCVPRQLKNEGETEIRVSYNIHKYNRNNRNIINPEINPKFLLHLLFPDVSAPTNANHPLLQTGYARAEYAPPSCA